MLNPSEPVINFDGYDSAETSSGMLGPNVVETLAFMM